jgi:hypothetical protein
MNLSIEIQEENDNGPEKTENITENRNEENMSDDQSIEINDDSSNSFSTVFLLIRWIYLLFGHYWLLRVLQNLTPRQFYDLNL